MPFSLLWEAPKCSSASEAAIASARLWGEDTLQHWGKGQVFRGPPGAPLTIPKLCSLAALDHRLTFPKSFLISFCFCFAKCSLKQVTL